MCDTVQTMADVIAPEDHAQEPLSTGVEILAPSAQFHDEAATALQNLRRALLDVLASIGGNATEPQKLARSFSLNKNLTWKISKVIRAADTFAAVTHMPGRAGMKIALDAFERAGAGSDAITRARLASDNFEHLVRRHSGDRQTMEAMVAGASTSRAIQAQRSEAHRKLAFRGNSAIWGVQARLQLSLHWVFPSQTPGMLDHAVVAGLVDFKRLRPDTRWSIALVRRTGANWQAEDPGGVSPLSDSPAGADPGSAAPLLSDFCSSPLPPVEFARGRPGIWRIELQPGAIGNTAALTCLAGWVNRGHASAFRVGDDTHGRVFCTLGTPAELVLHDVFIHKDLNWDPTLTPRVYGQLPTGPSGADDGPPPELPMLPEIEVDDGDPIDLLTPDLPDYHKIVAYVLARLKLDLRSFTRTRLRLAYPPIPTLVSLETRLPERP